MAISHLFLTISDEDYALLVGECELFNVSFESNFSFIVHEYCERIRLEDVIEYENDPRRSLSVGD